MIQEAYSMTPTEMADALSRTVLRAQLTDGPGAAFDRAERTLDGFGAWVVRLVFAGTPLALGIYLLVATEWRQLGLMALGVAVVVYLMVVGFQRMQGRFEGAIDSKADAMIARSGRGGLQKAMEQGKLAALHGDLRAELTEELLQVHGNGGHTVTIPDVHAAWRASTDRWLVLGADSPGPWTAPSQWPSSASRPTDRRRLARPPDLHADFPSGAARAWAAARAGLALSASTPPAPRHACLGHRPAGERRSAGVAGDGRGAGGRAGPP